MMRSCWGVRGAAGEVVCGDMTEAAAACGAASASEDVDGAEDVAGVDEVMRVWLDLMSRWRVGAWASWARWVEARWEMVRRWWDASAAWSGGGSVAKISAKMWSWGPLAAGVAGGGSHREDYGEAGRDDGGSLAVILPGGVGLDEGDARRVLVQVDGSAVHFETVAVEGSADVGVGAVLVAAAAADPGEGVYCLAPVA